MEPEYEITQDTASVHMNAKTYHIRVTDRPGIVAVITTYGELGDEFLKTQLLVEEKAG